MTSDAAITDADGASDRRTDLPDAQDGSGSEGVRNPNHDAGESERAAPLESNERATPPAATETDATGRWRIGLAVALVTIGIGLLAESLPIFAASLVGLTYAASGRLIPPPSPELDVERSLAPEAAISASVV